MGAMIDGEGSVHATRPRRITVGNTELEIISALLRVTGMGHIHATIMPSRKPFFVWTLSRFAALIDFSDQVRPYSVKLQNTVFDPLQTTGPQRRGILRVCPTCGADSYRPLGLAHGPRFCSIPCANRRDVDAVYN
jgi:hypothetical protein